MRLLFQTRFPRFYRKWSGDRDVSARATHLKAAMENVFMTTTERKRMSTKTTFKRIALVAVAALGLGVLSVAPAVQAAQLGETLAISSATGTATTGDTATATITHTWGTTQSVALTDSSTIKYTCQKPTAAASCPTVTFYQTATSETVNTQVVGTDTYPLYKDSLWTETAATVAGTVKSVVGIKAVNFATAGTYVYTFYTVFGAANTLSTVTPVTWTITASAPSTAATGLSNIYVSNDTLGYTAQTNRANFTASSDSAVTATAGTVLSPTAVATAFVVVKNADGDTRTATATGTKNTSSGTAVTDTLTVTVSGPGLVSSAISATRAKSATVNAYNGTLKTGTNSTASGESLTVWSDGTAGTATITYSLSTGVVVGSFSVTFWGTGASAAVLLSDTITSLTTAGTTTVNLTGTVKDSAGNVLKSGTFYVFSSDTKVAGAVPTSTNAGSYQTAHACNTFSATGVMTCSVVLSDTGVATLTLRDSWTVAASTWTSNAVDLTVTGNTVASVTATFDKATYAPGEKAILTITGKDAAGRGMATRADHVVFSSVVSTPNLSATGVAGQSGTQGTAFDATELLSYQDTGVETRVVYMPTYGTSVSYVIKFATFGDISGGLTTVTASATVADPTKDAADAATDAALEATDAAYAAQDAAQLAAEAADAATAAAEAATAAVEDLATQVASLFADLQKQITTLANVVAKIAKKVKA